MKPDLLCTSKSIYDLTPLPVGLLLDYPFIGLKNRLHTQRHLRTNQGQNFSPDDFLPTLPRDYRSMYDLSTEEMNARFWARVEELKRETLGKGLPLTYRDERCPTNDYFIRKYQDGTTFLAFLDTDRKEYILLCQIDG